MTWLTSLRDQLPLLLVMSPVIGFAVACLASKFEPDLIRPLSISNAVCTLLILVGIGWQFEADLAADAEIVRLAKREIAASNPDNLSIDEVHRTLDRRRVDRIGRQWFAVDGLNIIPILLLAATTLVAIWGIDPVRGKISIQTSKSGVAGDASTTGDSTDSPASRGSLSHFGKEESSGVKSSNVRRIEPFFYPIALLYEAASLGVLTGYDVRAFLMASASSALTMSVMIARWGNSERRSHASRFLFAQAGGGALIAFGLSMVVVAVPWMKMQDAATQPTLSWQIASITHDIQKWTTRNELAFHYVSEVFPWMLLILSLGFAIQSGLFPFHSWQIGVISGARPAIAALFIAGTLSASCIGWLRFVLPLAPDLLAAFDMWLVIPSLGSALWGAILAVVARDRRERIALVQLSFLGISLLGCYCFSRIGMSAMWLMQQQLTATFCTILLLLEFHDASAGGHRMSETIPTGLLSNRRTTLLMLCIPAVGLFASGFAIQSELLREDLLMTLSPTAVVLLLALAMYREFDRPYEPSVDGHSEFQTQNPVWFALLVMGLLSFIVNLVPGLPLHLSETEFARIFRRIERIAPAVSAEIPTNEPESPPEND